MNHTGVNSPGIASCFTRIAGTPKLWMTSLLESCTITGRFDRQVHWLTIDDVVLAVRRIAIEAELDWSDVTSATDVVPKWPSAPG